MKSDYDEPRRQDARKHGIFLAWTSDEVLGQAVRHGNEDLTIQCPAGKVRLVFGSEAWMRYNRYLEERNIGPHVEQA